MEQNDNSNLNKDSLNIKNNAIWKPVMIFFAKTTSWIIFPLIFAVLAGKYVSKSFGSQTLFFLFVMFGFGITCFGVYREIRDYKKDLDSK